MRVAVLTLLAFFTSQALAQKEDSSTVPEQYTLFQGEWIVIPGPTDELPKDDVPEIVVTVTGKRFELSGPAVTKELQIPLEFRVPASKNENPYRYLRDRGAKDIDDIVDVENQITVFWFVGIFKLTDDKLELALTYCGQGTRARDLRLPSSFDKQPIDGEARISLKRKQVGELSHARERRSSEDSEINVNSAAP